MIDIFNLEPNKITTNLEGYSMIIMSEASGDGKTDSMKRMLESIATDGKKPLFIEFEDRYQNIPNIVAVRVHNMGELNQVKSQLSSPKAHDLYSCVVLDTLDVLDSMIEKYVAVNREVEITGDLNFGKGNKCIKNALWFIDELRQNGWTVHSICQSTRNENIMTHEVTYDVALNKETWRKVSQGAYLIGMLTRDTKTQDRYVTFNKTAQYIKLKDTLGFPKKINVKDFKKELEKAIKSIPNAEFTDENTINKKQEKKDFNDIITRGNELGSKLFEAGKIDEVYNIFRTHIGIENEETKQPKMLNALLPSQVDLAEVVVQLMQELCDKYDIK